MSSTCRKLFLFLFLGMITGLFLLSMLFGQQNSPALAQGATPTPCRAIPNACPADVVVPVMGTEPSANDIAATFNQQATDNDIPVPLLMAMGYKESTWNQFSASAGQLGCTVMPPPSNDDSCDYGLMQINWIHNNDYDFTRVVDEYGYNISTGVNILDGQWDYRPQVNTGNRTQVLHWYNALWGYNGWIRRNNPLQYPRERVWGKDPIISFPYQERIFYIARDAPEIEGASRWNSIGDFPLPDDDLFANSNVPIEDILIFDVEASPVCAGQATFHYILDTYQYVVTQITIRDNKPWQGGSVVKTLPVWGMVHNLVDTFLSTK